MKKLLIATRNPGKLREYKAIFKELDLPLKLVSLRDLGIEQKVKEDGETFEENAIKKARFYSKLANLPVLGDDSGIEIDFLNGEPGVKSRRWPGYDASDGDLRRFTLEKLEGVPEYKRGAQLRAILCLVLPGDKKNYTFEGKLRGRIAQKSIKKRFKGYPFRSLFIPLGAKKYLGELHIVAHRKKAIKKALSLLRTKFK